MNTVSLAESGIFTSRLNIKFCLYAAIIYFLVTTSSAQIYLFLDYSSSLGLRDLVFFQQALHNFTTDGTLETSLPADTSVGVHDRQSIFGGHAYLFLVFLIPLYYLFKTPFLLMLSQPLAYILMIFVVYKILKDVYKENLKIIYLILILLLLNPTYSITLQNFNVYGFHLEFYFPPLFLAAYYFYAKENLPLFAIFYLLSLSIIEYYSLIWITFSLYTIFVSKNPKRIDFFVLTFSFAYLACAFLFFIPYFRGTSLPWYARVLSMRGPGFDPELTQVINLAKTLGINLLFNFAIFLFLPLRNIQTLILLLPWYSAFTLAYLNGYVLPLTAGSWHGNAIYPVILLGYIKEFEKLAERRTKINILKVGFAIAVALSVAIQSLRPAYNHGLWALISNYSGLRDDYKVIQSIKREMSNQPVLVSFQLGKYFGDFEDVDVLENKSNIGENVRYILYYSGDGSLSDQKLREIRKRYRATKEYKDIILFEKLGTPESSQRNDKIEHALDSAPRFHPFLSLGDMGFRLSDA
jgi:uncharacterized membrane protein